MTSFWASCFEVDLLEKIEAELGKEDNSLRELVTSGQYEAAVKFLSEREEGGALSSSELVLKGQCLQLSPKGGAKELEAAESSFNAALSTDPEYVPALLELGWFYYAVEDDAKRALPFFDRAIAVSLEQLKEAIKGKRDCVEELQSAGWLTRGC